MGGNIVRGMYATLKRSTVHNLKHGFTGCMERIQNRDATQGQPIRLRDKPKNVVKVFTGT